MKNLKIWLIILCAAGLAAFSNLTVLAEGDKLGEIIGYVAGLQGDTVHIIGDPLTEGGFSDVLLAVGGVPVYDLLTGFPVPSGDIAMDMGVRAAYTHTAGEPFPAAVFWLNWDYDGAAVFTVAVSENIRYGQDGAVFLSADGKYLVAITPDTQIVDPMRTQLLPEEIVPGMEFFVWVDIITASTPALAYPDKVVLVH